MRKPTKLCGASLSALLVMVVSPIAAADNVTTYIPEGYSIETVPFPKDTRFEVGGLDINAEGDVAVATRLGDVWILPSNDAIGDVKGEDWKKFASGLGESTGLLWDDDGSIIVANKLELTRLVDLDKDGISDKRINIANDWAYNQNYHEFHFGTVKDSKGNLYGSLNLASNLASNLVEEGPGKMYSWRGKTKMRTGGGYRGWAYQVTPEGEFVPYATGFRSPAGVGMSPHDELFITDNQGDWVPTSSMHHVRKDGFHGHPAGLVDHPDYDEEKLDSMDPEDFAEMMHKPVVWLPHEDVARSPGNPIWDLTGGKFGPFEGQVFVPEHTGSSVFRVMMEKVGGEYQGAAINFADGFQSANIRIAFDPKGRMWFGQTTRGWPSKGNKPFGVQRLVWDGKSKPFELQNISLTKTGFDLTFTQEVDPETAKEIGFKASQWHYNYNNEYGSPKIDVADLEIKAAKLSDDKKTVSLSFPLTAGKVVKVQFDGIRSAEGKSTSVADVFYTLNMLR